MWKNHCLAFPEPKVIKLSRSVPEPDAPASRRHDVHVPDQIDVRLGDGRLAGNRQKLQVLRADRLPGVRFGHAGSFGEAAAVKTPSVTAPGSRDRRAAWQKHH